MSGEAPLTYAVLLHDVALWSAATTWCVHCTPLRACRPPIPLHSAVPPLFHSDSGDITALAVAAAAAANGRGTLPALSHGPRAAPGRAHLSAGPDPDSSRLFGRPRSRPRSAATASSSHAPSQQHAGKRDSDMLAGARDHPQALHHASAELEGSPTSRPHGALPPPVILYGHRHPPCAVAFQLDSLSLPAAQQAASGSGSGPWSAAAWGPRSNCRPHLISVDESGRALVWALMRWGLWGMGQQSGTGLWPLIAPTRHTLLRACRLSSDGASRNPGPWLPPVLLQDVQVGSPQAAVEGRYSLHVTHPSPPRAVLEYTPKHLPCCRRCGKHGAGVTCACVR